MPPPGWSQFLALWPQLVAGAPDGRYFLSSLCLVDNGDGAIFIVAWLAHFEHTRLLATRPHLLSFLGGVAFYGARLSRRVGA